MKIKQRFDINRPIISDITTKSDDWAIVPIIQEKADSVGLIRSQVLGYWDTIYLAGIKILKFKAADNDLKVKVLGSIDGETFDPDDDPIEDEFEVTTEKPIIKRIQAYWLGLQIQVKPATSGQNGTLSAQAVGIGIGCSCPDLVA